MNGAKRMVLALFLALTLAGTAATSALASPTEGCQGLVAASVVGDQDHEQSAEILGGCEEAVEPSWNIKRNVKV